MTSIKDRLRPDTTYRIAYGDLGEDLNEPRFILGYWSIRCLAAALRLMLTASQVNHWIVCYDAIEEDKDGWSKKSYLAGDKPWLREEHTPLMNLPFLVDCSNDRIIVQTNAVFLFLGRELSMLGKNLHEQSLCEQLLCEIKDIQDEMVRFAYASKGENELEEAKQLVQNDGGPAIGFDKLEDYLIRKNVPSNASEMAPFLVGDRLSAPDCYLWEMLDQFEGFCKFYGFESMFGDGRPLLRAFKFAFETLPEVQVYVKSDCNKMPYHSPYARFGSNPFTLGKYERGMKTPWKGKGIVNDLRQRSTTAGQKRHSTNEASTEA